VPRKPLVNVLVALGIAVNVGLLFINLSPERPHLVRPRKLKVLLRASLPRIDWMRENEFSEYSRARDLDFEFISAKTFEEVYQLLLQERDHPTGIALADIDDEHAGELREKGLVRPIAQGAKPADLTAALAEYIPESVKRGQLDGVQWYLPKRALVDVAVFLRPAVEDAYLHWHQDRPAIEAALKEANGVGLPQGYELERSPEEWDTYDLFVAGFYWARHPAHWAEPAAHPPHDHPPPATVAPRVGYPCGGNEDANDEFLNALYRHGATDQTFAKMDSPAAVDTLQWRALFRKHGLVPAACAGEGLDSFDINGLFHQRKLAWAPIDQADSLWLHGGSRRDAEPGMPGAGDLAWSTLPVGASLELNAKGEPARVGRSFSFEEVHLWALPVHSPDPRTAFDVARFLDQKGLQQRETEAQGMLPIRNDLRQDYPILFRLSWMQQMLDASFRQIERGSGDVPDEYAEKEFDDAYARLRQAVVEERPIGAPVSAAAIRAAIAKFLATAQAPEEEKAHGR
jgi:ABC-type glycerol-3-phosphate transport system substrate-binding protein